MEKAKEKQKEKNERGGEEMKNNGKRKHQKGITLIALVITIIVLLILAGVSIAMLTGENGILTKASGAKVENAHASVKEAMRLEYAEYIFEKNQGQSTGTLIDYLQGKEIIGEAGEDGKYKIDVEKLSNTAIDLGKGTDGKDVYMLEEIIEGEEVTGSLGEIAATEPVKLAESTSDGKKYKIMYYGKKASEDRELEILTEINETKTENIVFEIVGDDGKTYYEYEVKKGTTWNDFVAEYENIFYINGFGDICLEEEGITLFNINLEDYKGFYVAIAGVDPTDVIKSGTYHFFPAGGECVYPNSNILMSEEGKTTQAKEIKEGDNITYYNFETEQVEIGKVEKVYIHKQATDFVRYKFEDGSYLEATDYHPIYTKEGWKSYTRRNGYEKPEVGDAVKTEKGWKKLVSIESFEGLEDCYDFVVKGKDGKIINNYYANGTLVQGSYKMY